MTNEQEVLEIAKKHGAKRYTDLPGASPGKSVLVFSVDDFLSTVAAIKEKHAAGPHKQKRDEERDSLINMQSISIEKYQAQIAMLVDALTPYAENIPANYRAPFHSGITDARTCRRCSRAYKAYLAISDTQQAAAAYEAEHKIKVIETLAKEADDKSFELVAAYLYACIDELRTSAAKPEGKE